MSDYSEDLQKAVDKGIPHKARKTEDGFEIVLKDGTSLWPAGTIFGYDKSGQWSFADTRKEEHLQTVHNNLKQSAQTEKGDGDAKL